MGPVQEAAPITCLNEKEKEDKQKTRRGYINGITTVTECTNSGYTPLRLATNYEHLYCGDILEARYLEDTHKFLKEHPTPKHDLISEGTNYGNTPLRVAANYDHLYC